MSLYLLLYLLAVLLADSSRCYGRLPKMQIGLNLSMSASACWQQLRILVTDSRTLTGINRPHRSLIGAAREARLRSAKIPLAHATDCSIQF